MSPAAPAPPPPAPDIDIDPSIDWRASMRVREISNHPDVRARIVRVTGAVPSGMTADQFLDAAKPLLAAAGAGNIPLKALKDVAVPFYAKMGLKTNTELSQGFKNTFGETLAAVLCSFASRGQPLVDMAEATNGCVVNAKMPSSMWSWEGNMIVTLEQRDEGTMLRANLTVPGQAFDWGKSKRVLQDLIDDVMKYRDMPPAA
ncbi:MAG: hypothetical protein R3C13_08940 [Hyphomonas sp.]|uniref:hypothetical protein n=1 Tax=Hyphomonas sp. TaxID=87 RepID=UPI0035270A1A